MDDSRKNFERTGGCVSVVEEQEQHNDVQSVQNLETIINEGLRVALMKETPD